MGRFYTVGTFAKLTGVSIRTLHHYDRIGLLRPSSRSEAGYRLYATRELLRLQQILTLRYLGFSLSSIGEILERPDFDLEASMRIQAAVIRERIDAYVRVGQALGDLLQRHGTTGEWDWELANRAAAAARDGLTKKEDEMSEYYTAEEIAKRFEALRAVVPAEEIEAVQRLWPALLAEMHVERDLNPASERARELADRWDALTERSTRGFDPKMAVTVAESYRQNAYAQIEGAPTLEDFAFIGRVRAAREA